MHRQSFRSALLGLTLLSGGLAGCEDLLTESPPNLLVPDNLFATTAGFDAALNGLYDQVRQEYTGMASDNQHRSFYMTVGNDNVYASWPNDMFGLVANGWGVLNSPSFVRHHDMWSWLYSTVNAANTIIGRAEDPSLRWNAADKSRVLGEARLIRAWGYRHLSYLWGGVPLALTEATGVKTDWTRASRDEVLKQIEADLIFAEANLPETRPDDGKVTRAVAQHYLAEHYLRTGDNAKAEQKAEAVVNSGRFSLVTRRYGVRGGQPGTPFSDQFIDGNTLRSQGNTEVLWALEVEQNVPGGGRHIQRRGWAQQYFRIPGIPLSVDHGGRGQGRASPTNWAWTLYEPQDDRFSVHAVRKYYVYSDPKILPAGKRLGDTLWLANKPEAMEDPTRMTTRKWDWADPGALTAGNSYGDIAYLRLAETLLILAEAELKQNKRAEAAEHINAVRRRSNATPIAAAQVTMDFILDERSRELIGEEQRRYTLLRTGTWLERTRRHNPMAGPNVAARDTLFPIPQPVIDANLDATIEQNPGY